MICAPGSDLAPTFEGPESFAPGPQVIGQEAAGEPVAGLNQQGGVDVGWAISAIERRVRWRPFNHQASARHDAARIRVHGRAHSGAGEDALDVPKPPSPGSA